MDGFRIRLNSSADAGQYACHAKFDVAEKFDIYFKVQVNCMFLFEIASFVHVDDNISAFLLYRAIFLNFSLKQVDHSNFLGEPKIISKADDNGNGNKNDQLELSCTVETTSNHQLEMKWELPNENIAKNVRFFTKKKFALKQS